MFLVDTLDPPIRFTEGNTIGDQTRRLVEHPSCPEHPRRVEYSGTGVRLADLSVLADASSIRSVHEERISQPLRSRSGDGPSRHRLGQFSAPLRRAKQGHRSTGSRGSRPRLRIP